MRVVFTRSAVRDVRRLDPPARRRLLRKLAFYFRQRQPLKFAERLTDPRVGTYRMRVGDYRVIFDIDAREVVVHRVGHRSDVYR